MKIFPQAGCALAMFLFCVWLCGCATYLPFSVKVQRNIEYAQTGGQSLRLDIYSPRKPVGKLPVVVWIHGGSWNTRQQGFLPDWIHGGAKPGDCEH